MQYGTRRMVWKGNRIYRHYSEWEDYINGMWRKLASSEEDSMLKLAIYFTGNHLLYGKWMISAVDQWPITCEHNLSDLSQNRRAFIGHCAACLGIGSPEYITRMAWGYLTREQQDSANAMADIAIKRWEETYDMTDDLFGGIYA